ncbi:MAG: diacylglycerol kinase family protein [Spirochaetales bacterium]|nr:diacylglycerol kinase family protein [Spirochaetales bacterium]
MNKCFQLIINPARYPYYAKQLEHLVKYIPKGTVHVSRDEGHFRELITDFIKGNDPYLLIWGGDGTANMTLNSLMKGSDKKRLKSIAVGFLRGGSGNGIQDSYEVPHNLKAQVRTYLNSMEKGFTQKVDLLKVQFDGQTEYGQLFGSGIDSHVLGARNGITRNGTDNAPRSGFIPYVIPAIRTAYREARLLAEPQYIKMSKGRFAIRGTRTNAEFPFQEYTVETRAPLIEIGVRPYYGWYYKICPDVVCNDGYMDAYLFNLASRLSVLRNLPYLWNGLYHRINKRYAKKGLPLIEHYKIKEMEFSPREERSFHIDGELFQSDEAIRLSVKNKALKFLVPESFHEKFHPIHDWDMKVK